jgi:hypothetical protein
MNQYDINLAEARKSAAMVAAAIAANGPKKHGRGSAASMWADIIRKLNAEHGYSPGAARLVGRTSR